MTKQEQEHAESIKVGVLGNIDFWLGTLQDNLTTVDAEGISNASQMLQLDLIKIKSFIGGLIVGGTR